MKRVIALLVTCMMLGICLLAAVNHSADAPKEGALPTSTSSTESSAVSDLSDSSFAEQDERILGDKVADDQAYQNEYFGINYQLPEGFSFVTDDVLAQQYNPEASKLAASSEDQAKIKAGDAYVDFAALTDDSSESVCFSIAYTNDEVSTHELRSEYADSVASQIRESFQEAGLGEPAVSMGESAIGGQQLVKIDIDLADYGIVERVYLHSRGNYVCMMTFVAHDFDEVEHLAGDFSFTVSD